MHSGLFIPGVELINGDEKTQVIILCIRSKLQQGMKYV